MSRRIEDMHAGLQVRVMKFRERCKAIGIDVIITCTYRSNAEQAELYAQGRTKPGPIVTKAKPGQSKHNHTENGKPASLAFDFVPLRYGKPVWGTKGADLALWNECGKIGKQLGFTWFGDPGSPFREFPHMQDTTP